MSIVIKGAQMPENCKECLYVYDGFACTITGEYIHWDIAEKTRMPDCPLMEQKKYAALVYVNVNISAEQMRDIKYNGKRTVIVQDDFYLVGDVVIMRSPQADYFVARVVGVSRPDIGVHCVLSIEPYEHSRFSEELSGQD